MRGHEEVHVEIRKILASLLSEEFSQNIQILYGGSVKADNANELVQCENIDGFLVGGASLKVESLLPIFQAF